MKKPWRAKDHRTNKGDRCRAYMEKFGEFPDVGRFEDFEEFDEKVKKALETGKPIPKIDIPDDMLI